MRLFKTISLLLISAIMIISCGDNNQLENDNYYIHVDPVTIEAPVEGGEFDIHIEAKVPDIWILKSDSDFISAEQMSASTYSEQLLYVYPNNTGSARIGSATVSASGCQDVTITVLQKGENEGSGGGGSTQINAPSGLRASASGNTISLSWNSVSGASYYQVYYSSTSSNPRNYLDYTYETSYSYTVNSPGTYYFAVMAIGSDGNESSYSDSASCTVSGSGGGGASKPSAPSGLSAYWDGPAAYPYVVLSWNSVSNATSYQVYRSSSASGSYSKIADSNYGGYSDSNVSIGKTYYYKVKASNSAGASDYSNYVSVTLEDKRKPGPVSFGNCSATSTSITLRWTIPTDPSYGKPTKIVLSLYEPTYQKWVDFQELSGTATSVTFNFGMWIDADGYVKCGVVTYNDYGSGGGSAKIYDTKNKKWII